MANDRIQLRKKTGVNPEDYSIIYPETQVDYVKGLLGGDGKVKTELLPNAVFDQLRFIDVATGTWEASTFLNLILTKVDEIGYEGYMYYQGGYWVANGPVTLPPNNATANGQGLYIKIAYTNADYQTGVEIQSGDWFVITHFSGIEDDPSNPLTIHLGIVNNTYELATNNVAGIVTAVNYDASLNGMDLGEDAKTKALTEAWLVYNAKGGTLTGASADSRYLAQADHKHSASTIVSGTLAVARGGTDISSYTKGDILYASGATTLAKLAGDGLNNDGKVLKNVAGLPSWQNETWYPAQASSEGYVPATVGSANAGKVLKVSSTSPYYPVWSTEYSYTLPLAASNVRGGIRIGYTSTDTNRAVTLLNEQAYISLPRAIPKLNNSASTSNDGGVFYAPKISGDKGQKLLATASGAPSWVDAGVIYHDVTAFDAYGVEGDILFFV